MNEIEVQAYVDNIKKEERGLVCNICLEINKTPKGRLFVDGEFKGLKVYRSDLVGPFIQRNLAVPHVCLLSCLKEVQNAYDNKWISDECFDDWMATNGGDYQLGKGGKLQYLWDERLTDFENVKIEDQDAIIKDLNFKSSIFKIVRCKYHGSLHVSFSISASKLKKYNRVDFKLLNKLFPFYSDTDKSHTNIDVATLLHKCVMNNKLGVVRFVLDACPIGMFNPMVVMITLNRLGNDHCGKIWDLMAIDKACCMSNGTFKSYFKAISIAIRRTSLWYDHTNANLSEMTSCASWELALGRHSMISDWEEERHNRLVDYLPLKLPQRKVASAETNSEYLEYAEPIMDNIIAQLMDGCPIWPDFKSFCMNRNSWLSSGSAGSKFVYVRGVKTRVNKRTYMESIPIKDMVGWLESEPMIRSIASEKYEMGKARAIYGTEVEDQCIMSYLLSVLEPKLSKVDNLEGGLVGKSEVLSIVRRMNVVAKEGEECTMLDYSDFNRQHPPDAQSLVFKSIKKWLIRNSAHDDAIKVAEWCEKALLNQWVKFPGSSKYEKIVQGLFSGMRGTNFVNTILNKMYYKVAEKWMRDNLKLKPVNEFVLHQGDDVWVSNKSRIWAIGLYRTLQRCGLIFSDKKQIQDRNMAEFLRVVYSKEGARGYLGRSLATLIERPLSSELEISPTMKAIGVNSQIQTCFRRGLSKVACDILWDSMVTFALKSVISGISTISVPVNLVSRSFTEGGLDIGKPLTMAKKVGTIPPIPVMQYESEALEDVVPKHTTDAYITVMSEQIGEEFNVEPIRRVLHASNVADSIPQSDKVSCLLKFHKQVKIWKDKCNRIPAKPAVRLEIAMDEWSENEVDDKFLRILNDMTRSWEYEKSVIMEENEIEMLTFVISKSPYRDIPTARRAKKLNIVEAARMCILTSSVGDMKAACLDLVDGFMRSTSYEIAARMLSSIRGYGPSMESWFNPVPLSFVTNYSINQAVIKSRLSQIKVVEQWDKIVDDCLRIGFKTAYKHKLLVDISHY